MDLTPNSATTITDVPEPVHKFLELVLKPRKRLKCSFPPT